MFHVVSKLLSVKADESKVVSLAVVSMEKSCVVSNKCVMCVYVCVTQFRMEQETKLFEKNIYIFSSTLILI